MSFLAKSCLFISSLLYWALWGVLDVLSPVVSQPGRESRCWPSSGAEVKSAIVRREQIGAACRAVSPKGRKNDYSK